MTKFDYLWLKLRAMAALVFGATRVAGDGRFTARGPVSQLPDGTLDYDGVDANFEGWTGGTKVADRDSVGQLILDLARDVKDACPGALFTVTPGTVTAPVCVTLVRNPDQDTQWYRVNR